MKVRLIAGLFLFLSSLVHTHAFEFRKLNNSLGSQCTYAVSQPGYYDPSAPGGMT